METFLKSLSSLTQLIRENNSLDPFSFDLISLANLSEEDLYTIKEEIKDIELIHINEFWDLTEIIYKNLMLKTISKDLTDYFLKIQSREQKTIEVSYQFVPWKAFVVSSSDSDQTTISLQTDYAEIQIQQFLDYLEINDNSWKEDLYDFDYEFNFESELESIFRGIAFECWKETAQQTKNQLKATLQESNGGSHIYDLNTRQRVN